MIAWHVTLAAAVAVLSVPASAEMLQGRVIAVSDGDSLTILVDGQRPVRVRLAEVDAPESAQAHGAAAKRMLAGFAFNRTVSADITSVDRYGRAIALVSVDRLNVNAAMVRSGLAWAYIRYQRDHRFSALEAEARAQRRGLWRDPDPVPPWKFRRSGGN